MGFTVQEEDGLGGVLLKQSEETIDPSAALVALLHGQQHRGKDLYSVSTARSKGIENKRYLGLVNMPHEDVTSGLAAIGQVRFSRDQTPKLENIPSLVSTGSKGEFSLVMSGSIEVLAFKDRFENLSEAEIVVKLIEQNEHSSLFESVKHVAQNLNGAFCLLLLTKTSLIVARDRFGFRPVCIGKVSGKNKGYAVASESCGFGLIDAEYERDVHPGEILEISQNLQIHAETFATSTRRNQCAREHSFMSRPDSRVFNRDVQESRENFGRILWEEFPIPGDKSQYRVVGVPDFGTATAIAYAEASRIGYITGLLRNHYDKGARCSGIDCSTIKITANRFAVENKRIILVTTQLLTGSSTKEIICKLRTAGAIEVSLLIASPPITSFCYWGAHLPEQRYLLAHRHQSEVDEMCTELGADHLGFISMIGYLKALGNGGNFCTSCFTGKYPKGLIQIS